MKYIFYTTSVLSIITIIVGIVRFANFRDRLYLAASGLIFVAIISGLAYLVNKKTD